ncbi:MAG: helix-turn-helix transcriptional regulator [Bacteroidota bacterium]
MKNQHLVELGKQIRFIRKRQGLSQEQLAYNAGIDRSYCGAIERGERNVSVLTLVKIAFALDCKIADFSNSIPHE